MKMFKGKEKINLKTGLNALISYFLCIDHFHGGPSIPIPIPFPPAHIYPS